MKAEDLKALLAEDVAQSSVKLTKQFVTNTTNHTTIFDVYMY